MYKAFECNIKQDIFCIPRVLLSKRHMDLDVAHLDCSSKFTGASRDKPQGGHGMISWQAQVFLIDGGEDLECI